MTLSEVVVGMAGKVHPCQPHLGDAVDAKHQILTSLRAVGIEIESTALEVDLIGVERVFFGRLVRGAGI